MLLNFKKIEIKILLIVIMVIKIFNIIFKLY